MGCRVWCLGANWIVMFLFLGNGWIFISLVPSFSSALEAAAKEGEKKQERKRSGVKIIVKKKMLWKERRAISMRNRNLDRILEGKRRNHKKEWQ